MEIPPKHWTKTLLTIWERWLPISMPSLRKSTLLLTIASPGPVFTPEFATKRKMFPVTTWRVE